jgi:hypothetical protein
MIGLETETMGVGMTDLQVTQPATLLAVRFRFFLSLFVPLSTIFQCGIYRCDCKNFQIDSGRGNTLDSD